MYTDTRVRSLVLIRKREQNQPRIYRWSKPNFSQPNADKGARTAIRINH